MSLTAASGATPESLRRQAPAEATDVSPLHRLIPTPGSTPSGIVSGGNSPILSRILSPAAENFVTASETYGWLTFTNSPDAGSLAGLVRLGGGDDGLTSVFTMSNNSDRQINNFWLRDGSVYATVDEYEGGQLKCTSIYQWDMEGRLLDRTETAKGFENAFYYNMMAYDPDNDVIYGYATNDEVNKIILVKAPGADPTAFTVLGEGSVMEAPLAMTYNTTTSQLIGVLLTGNVVDINTVSGKQTVIGSIPRPSYNCGLCYSPSDGGYLFNRVTKTESSLQLLDEHTFAVKAEQTYPYIYQLLTLQCTDSRRINESAPQDASDFVLSFTSGSTSGKASFVLPRLTNADVPILGNVDWELQVDNETYARGSKAAGGKIDVRITGLSEGTHTFRVRCSLGDNHGGWTSEELYTGIDTPLAPQNVELTQEKVSWDAVTSGEHSGFMAPEEVTYTVRLNGNVIARDVKGTSCPTGLSAQEPLDRYEASVVAVFRGKSSDPGYSTASVLGKAMQLPASVTARRHNRIVSIVDGNADGETIFFNNHPIGEEKEQMFTFNYPDDKSADEWLILPAMELDDAEAIYSFTVKTLAAHSSFEVKAGREPQPEAMTTDVMGALSTVHGYYDAGTDFHTSHFTVPEAGTYYIGIHVKSNPQGEYIHFPSFDVAKSTLSRQAPAAATGLKASPLPLGQLKASVEYTLPTTDYNGTAYSEGKTLKAVITNEDGRKFEAEGTAGSVLTTECDTRQGMNVLSISVFDGELESIPAFVKVYTGDDSAGRVNNLKAVTDRDNMGVVLTWDGPTTGPHGGFNDPDTGNTYTVCLAGAPGALMDILGVTEMDERTFHYTLPAGSPMRHCTIYVLAKNDLGESGYAASAECVIGTPYTLPASDTYTDGSVDLRPVVNLSTDAKLELGLPMTLTGNISITTPDKAKGIVAYKKNQACDFLFSLPKFSTEGYTRPAIELDMHGGYCENFAVNATAPGIETEELASYVIKDFKKKGRTTLQIALPEKFAGLPWVEITIGGHCKKASRTQAFVLYGYMMRNLADYDWGVRSLQGPSTASVGRECVILAEVANLGEEASAFPGGSWTLRDNDGAILASARTAPGSETTEPGATMYCPVTFTPTADFPKALTAEFVITPGDDAAINDSRSREITVAPGTMPVVTDLTAAETGYDHVDLQWSIPATGIACESFEHDKSFNLEGNSAGDFTRIDGDGKNLYTSARHNMVPGAGQPASFTVWSVEEIKKLTSAGYMVPAADGDKYAVAFCPADGTPADDWLISPRVEGGSKVSMHMRTLDSGYASESVEVLYSSTTDSPEAFRLIETLEIKEKGFTSPEWQLAEIELPEDACYFAIHYITADGFALLLDKIEYVPEGGAKAITGFAIYRDGESITGVTPVASAPYRDGSVAQDKEYSYNVLPVFADGTRGLVSNTLRVHTSGAEEILHDGKAIYAADGVITVSGYEGKTVRIVRADGMTVAGSASASAMERYPVASGVYVVSADEEDAAKIIVR